MRNAVIPLAVLLISVSNIAAAAFGGSVGDPQSGDSDQANWRGSHGGGGWGHRSGGQSGDSGGVIIDAPYPSGPYPGPYPYPEPYPDSAPMPSSPDSPPMWGSNTPTSPQAWPAWYYCDKPSGYYPYVKKCAGDWQPLPVTPPPPGTAPPIADGFWEHCDDPPGYFPYVAQCRHHWVAAMASTPQAEDSLAGPVPIADWFYCEDSKAYFPYVQSCTEDWHVIPAIPPPNIPAVAKTKSAPYMR